MLSVFIFVACGQAQESKHDQKINIQTRQTMDLSKIENVNVKKAIEALQSNNREAWYACFTKDATFTDDARAVDFKSFFNNAFDKNEKFLDIDKVENEGKDIYGNFYAGQWGTFRVYFRFHPTENGKFNRLDIGQSPQ